MASRLWAMLRDARYALPGRIERAFAGPDAAAAARLCAGLHRRGLLATVGYFAASDAAPHDGLAGNLAAIAALAGAGGDTCLALKAPQLRHDPAHIAAIAAAAAGMPMVFDAHAPREADATLVAVERLLPKHPGTGCALPARWRRSANDAARLRDTSARIRVVKGEWPDPEAPDGDEPGEAEARYLGVIAILAGRAAPVAVATHRPSLAERALAMLIESGTPCELEQLRGLPGRRTRALARRLGVPVRVYVPFGPGWWPYAIDKALARPYLPGWLLRDLAGSRRD